MRTIIVCTIALALTVSVFVIGRSGDDEATPQTTAATTTEPAGPTSEAVKNAIFERSYSECASTERAPLAGKYKLADQKDETLATGVGRGWVKYFKASDDALPDGRAGCLQALQEEKEKKK